VDEVLAVGDAEFQKKCLGKMKDVANHGRTILFVSHNMQAVQRLCDRAVLLTNGIILTQGVTEFVLSEYTKKNSNTSSNWTRCNNLRSDGFYFEKIQLRTDGTQPEIKLIIDSQIKRHGQCKGAFIAFDVLDSSGTAIMQALPVTEPFISPATEVINIRTAIDLPPMIPGNYTITAWVGAHHNATYDLLESCLRFDIDTSPSPKRTFPHYPNNGYIVPKSEIFVFNE
jgi:lipopolysaccharide transport system ATP-binding protein